MNSYGPCVASQLVNILQQSILFNVDKYKLSHKYTQVNGSLIGLLHDKYQSILEYGSGTMQVNLGKVHKYLGITLDYSIVGQVNITMLEYINRILNTFDRSDPTGVINNSSAALAIIFNVYKDCKN